jgi:hypothetical protein
MTFGHRLWGRLPLWLALLLVAAATTAAAQNNFAFDAFTVGGGGGTSTGSTYSISGTAGQADAGQMSGGSYVIRGGFWPAFAAASRGSMSLRLDAQPGSPPQLRLHGPVNQTILILASDCLGPQAHWTVVATTNSSVMPCTIHGLPAAGGRCVFYRAMLAGANMPPVLQPIGPRHVEPGQILSFTAVAQDLNIPAQTLTFSLGPGAPAGASIGATSGLFNWTPGVAGDYSITVRVTDNGDPPLSSAETIIVTVGNRPPVLTAIGNQTVAEETALAITATASDPDGGQTLTFSLAPGYPAGAAITSGGAFNWTPVEAQGPGSYLITVIVTDNGTPTRNDSETIIVTVNEVNKPPVLTAILDKSVGTGQTLAFNAIATDPDLPPQTLTFSLVSPPTGATITSGGAFDWTPAVAGSYPITVMVTDSGVPPLSASHTFTVTVTNLNHAPVLDPIGKRYVRAGYLFTIDATATDLDAGQVLTFSLGPGTPAGATIDPATGHFSWTPLSGGTNFIVVQVTDNGSPPASDEETITIYVSDDRPTLTGPANSDTGTFTLQWTYPWWGLGKSTDGYELQESTTSTSTGFTTIFSTFNQGDRQSPKTLQVTGRTSGTYAYRVRANDSGWSTWSDVVQVQVSPPPTRTRFINSTVYPVVSLKIDGVEQFLPCEWLPSGNYVDKQLSVGLHSFSMMNGVLDDYCFELGAYGFSGTVNQRQGVTEVVQFNNPTIQEILTRFSTDHTWTTEAYYIPGDFYPHNKAFKFFADGSYYFYNDGVYQGSGTYAEISRSGASQTVTFSVSGNQNFQGTLFEFFGFFTMRNGPSGVPTLGYYY